MSEAKRVTGKMSYKSYRCLKCGAVSSHQTNHYGEIYPRCGECGWKRPFEKGQPHQCLDPVPEGWDVPEPWKMVRLRDIMELVKDFS